MEYKVVKLDYYDNSNTFYEYLSDILKKELKNTNKLVLDFQNVMFLTSNSLGLLAKFQTRLTNESQEIFIINVNDALKKIFKITNFNDFFKIYDTLEEFNSNYHLRKNE